MTNPASCAWNLRSSVPRRSGSILYSVMFHAGGGLEYQLENRHYAVDIAADGAIAPQFDSIKTVGARLFLRYTYGGG
jgi:hypothetical protein